MTPKPNKRPWILLLRRKGLATEAGIMLRTAMVSGRYPHLMPEYEEWRQLHHQIAYVTWQFPKSEAGWAEYRQRLAELTAKQEELERFLSRQIPEMNLQQQLNRASRQAIAAILPQGATLVEVVQFHVRNFQAVKANGDKQWLPPRYLAFILSAGESESVEMVDLGEAKEIDELSRQFRELASEKPKAKIDPPQPPLKRGESVSAKSESRDFGFGEDEEEASEEETWIYPEVGKELYAKLIQPLKPYLPKQQVVYFSPDGELATLPFGILSENGSDYLMQEYGWRYLNVGRDLLRFNVEIPVNYSQPLVIANPDYDLRGNPHKPRLPMRGNWNPQNF
jgi:CHAT domain-containing protein